MKKKKVVHKYEWEYTRTFRYHWHDTGDMYNEGEGLKYYLQICCCTPIQHYIEKKLGYNLFYKGKKVAHAKTVKELKELAETL